MSKFGLTAYAKSHVPPTGHQRTYIGGYTLAVMANGIFLPIYILYDTRIVGISNSRTALAIAIAGLIGLPLTLVAGDLADRLGPRRMVLVGLVGQLLGMGSYVFVQGFWSLLAVVMSMNVFAYTYYASEGALMRRIAGADTVTFRSQVQTWGSIGLTVGATGAGIGIAIGSATAYRVMFLTVSAMYLVVVAVTLRIPDYEPLPKPPPTEDAEVSRWIVLRDRPFMAYALVAGCLTMSAFVEHQLLPIWIVGHSSAPRWTVALVFVINTAISVLLQMRLSKGVRTTRQGGRALLLCGIALMLAYLLLAAIRGHAPWLTVVLVVGGVVLAAVGQIWFASGRFALEFNLPPAHAQGQYDGFLNTVMTLSVTAAPLVLIGVVLDNGFVGWIGLGVSFLALGALSPVIAAWGERTRPEAVGDVVAEPADSEPMATAAAGEV